MVYSAWDCVLFGRGLCAIRHGIVCYSAGDCVLFGRGLCICIGFIKISFLGGGGTITKLSLNF